MAASWILIVLVVGSADLRNVVTQEFTTQQACEEAARQVRWMEQYSGTVKATCVPK